MYEADRKNERHMLEGWHTSVGNHSSAVKRKRYRSWTRLGIILEFRAWNGNKRPQLFWSTLGFKAVYLSMPTLKFATTNSRLMGRGKEKRKRIKWIILRSKNLHFWRKRMHAIEMCISNWNACTVSKKTMDNTKATDNYGMTT